MSTFLQRLVAAYRPLYQRGLLLDGRRESAISVSRRDAVAPAPLPTDAPALATAALTTALPRRVS